MKKIIFTDEEIRKIELLYSQGMGCAKIGEIFKLSKRPILELLRKRNLLNKGTSDGRTTKGGTSSIGGTNEGGTNSSSLVKEEEKERKRSFFLIL
jgi:hypothetical protein